MVPGGPWWRLPVVAWGSWEGLLWGLLGWSTLASWGAPGTSALGPVLGVRDVVYILYTRARE